VGSDSLAWQCWAWGGIQLSLLESLQSAAVPPDSSDSALTTYLVGGAVRDRLLGLPVQDRDWVVVGSTPETLEALGFRRVGQDFPVFLHPETSEQYALARCERNGPASPGATLEDDLACRDLTINAMAETPFGVLVDPMGGKQDLEARLLRHVGEAFADDPLRVLRVARFAARLAQLGFTVAPETLDFMARLVDEGRLDALTPERQWHELHAALETPLPRRFFEVLRDCGALRVVLPEIDALFGVPQPIQHHPEVDSGLHTLLVLDQATALSADPRVRFAALVHDLGKARTPRDELPRHIAHEKRGIEPITELCDRLRAPVDYRDLALAVCREHLLIHRIEELRPGTVLSLLERLDAFRRPGLVQDVVLACRADCRGRPGREDDPYTRGDRLVAFQRAAAEVRVDDLVEAGKTGKAIGDALRQRRIRAIKRLR